MCVYVADYEDCLTLLFNGDPVEYEKRKPNLDNRISLLNKGDKNSPWYRMCKAGVYMHWAFIGLRFDDRLKAASYFRKSFVLLKENQERFPDFEYDDIFFGIEEAAIGVLPDNYKWIASIFGLKGDLQQGANKITGFVKAHTQDDIFYREALVYSAYLNYFLLSDKEEAWRIVNSKEFKTKDNLMNAFVKANIALNFRKADEAKAVMEEAQFNKYYYTYPVLDYEYGYSLLHRLDTLSINIFKQFLANYKGGAFVKDAHQKLAYANYIFGRPETAIWYKKQIGSVGVTITDADKHAERFSENPDWPNKVLLRSQLLIDGGYYKRAYKMLSSYTAQDFKKDSEKLELYFRWARVNDELGNREEAIANYNKAIKLGVFRQEQFAARAALQLGFLYEKEGQNKEAFLMYEKALSMKNHDFKNAIDQQAKAGISRLNKLLGRS